jgi:hypothetical protein
MNAGLLVSLLAGLVIVFGTAAQAQRVGGADDRPGFRNQGGVNQGQPPAEYVVVSVDSYAQTVRLRAADGSIAAVFIPDGVYDLSKLSSGDKVRVDFLEPDGMNNRLSAGNLWPVKWPLAGHCTDD